MKAINLKEKLALVGETWHPHRISAVNDMVVLLTKLDGEFVWHSHDDEDELFLVIKGRLEMQFRDRTEIICEGELIVVPRGVEHCPCTLDGEEVHVLLFEKATIAHTGSVVSERTRTVYPEI